MKKISKTKSIILFGILLIGVLLYLAIFNNEGFLTVYNQKEDLAQLKAKNEKLKKENLEIRQMIEVYKTDPWAVEKIAREKLNLVKPGEIVYKIVREERPRSNTAENR